MKKNNTSAFLLQLILIICFHTVSIPSSFSQTRTIDSLFTALEKVKEDTSKIILYSALCRAYMTELNDMEKVQIYAAKAYTLSEPIHFKKGLGYGTFYLGLSHWMKGNFDMAMNSFKKATVLLKETVGLAAEGACYINIGQLYSEQGKYKEALEYIQKGVKTSIILKDKPGIQSGHLSIGNLYSLQGHYTQALYYFIKALKMGEEANDQIFCSCANNNIGDIFYAQNKLDKALFYYKKSVKYLEDIKEEHLAGSIYTGMGNVYWKKKQYGEALVYHLKDLNIKDKYDDKQGVAVACNKVGFDYFGHQKFDKALSYQLKSYNLCKQIGYKKGLIDACGGLGNVYEKQHAFSQSLNYYSEMLYISKQLDDREGLRDAYLNHASAYKKQNQFEKALQYTKLFHETNNILLNKNNFRQVNELNTRYETDKKEKEILLLTKDQQINVKIIRQHQLVGWWLTGGLGLLSISIFSIHRRGRFKQKANDILEKQNKLIEQKNVLIMDSIEYAQTIQQTVLPSKERTGSLLNDYFVLYQPKETVSGDFYWLRLINDQLVCAVADCTGHGVPGAFMSLLSYNMLENAVKKTDTISPGSVLQELNNEMIVKLTQTDPVKTAKYGMDISFITIHKTTGLLQFSGANNNIYIIREGKLIELKTNHNHIGEITELFINQQVTLKKGDLIYLFTDGYYKQKGGPDRKKLDSSRFKELLLVNCQLDLAQQKTKLEEAYLKWMGKTGDQTDDILILGLCF